MRGKKLNNSELLNDSDLITILNGIPNVVSDLYYQTSTPRFPTIFKEVKEKIKETFGVSYNKLSDVQKYDIEDMVRDTYYGLKECD